MYRGVGLPFAVAMVRTTKPAVTVADLFPSLLVLGGDMLGVLTPLVGCWDFVLGSSSSLSDTSKWSHLL